MDTCVGTDESIFDLIAGDTGGQGQGSYAVVAVSDVIDKTPNKKPLKLTTKYKGLQNQGATWYLNSLIQTLFMTPEFRSILYSWSYKEAEEQFNKEYCIPMQLQILFGGLQTSMRNVISTKGLTHSFNWHSNEVSYQQDIQEFWRVLFNAIEESFKIINKPWKINELYQGWMKDYLKCTEWGYERNIISEYMDLSLPIHDPFSNINNSSLEEALENYVKSEVLDGDNKYEWSGCNKKVKALKGQIFDKVPEVLFLQLSRFTFNQYGNAVKINNRVSFPFILNMNKFVSEDIDTKIKQTEQKIIDDDNAQMNPAPCENVIEDVKMETEEERRQKSIDDVNERLDNILSNTKDKEEHERVWMGEEDSLNTDVPEYLLGPKKVHYYGGPEDDYHIEYSKEEQHSSLHNTQANLRSDQEILDEIERNTRNYILQGEYVYSLYSVLIHSGGVSGGHYSAYIKSFEDDKWYHFNDSKVSEIDISEVEEMFGDGKSNRNAYLVMYKKIKLKQENSVLIEDKENKVVITDSMIPDYIMEELEKDNEEFKEEEKSRLEQEAYMRERDAHVTLRVFSKVHKNEDSTEIIYSNQILINDPRIKIDEKKFDFKNYQTLSEATEYAYNLYDLKSKGVLIEDVRLRLYSVGFKIMKQTFENKEMELLKDLGINMSTPLFLETKLPTEKFEFLPENMIAIRYYLWKEGITSLDEIDLTHHILFVNKNNSINDLEQDIYINMLENGYLQDGQVLENIVLFKEKYGIGQTLLQTVWTSDEKDKSVSSWHILDGTRIFVDFRNYPEEDTKWEAEFRTHANRYRISYNNPFNGPVDQWANDEYKTMDSTYDHFVSMEAHQTLFELKQNISTTIGLDMEEFKMMTTGIKYEELRDLTMTVYEAGMSKNSRIFIEIGKPTELGTVNVLIYEAEFNHIDDNELFRYSDLLFDIKIGKDISVREFKAIIAKEYSKKQKDEKGMEVDLEPNKIRIRDKGFDRLGKIMRDGKYVKEYGLCKDKSFAIQVLGFEEIITDEKDVMVVIREWIPWDKGSALTQKQEILLNRKMKYHEIVEALKNYSIIPEGVNTDNYEICKVSSISRLIVEDLGNEKWVELSKNGGFTTLEGAPLYLRSDGYLIIIRNKENFKTIASHGESEVIAVGSIEDSIASKYDKFDIKSSGIHRIPYVGGGHVQKGVTIQVMDKKAQEEAEKKKQEEEEKRKKLKEESLDERGNEAFTGSTDTSTYKPKSTNTTTNKLKSTNKTTHSKDVAIGDDEVMVNPDADLDFLYELEDA